jgi:hypothetical protein
MNAIEPWKTLVVPDFPHEPWVTAIGDAVVAARLFNRIRSKCLILPPRVGGIPTAVFKTDWLRAHCLRVAALYDHESDDADQEAIMRAIGGQLPPIGTAVSPDDEEPGSVWRLLATSESFRDFCYSHLVGSVLIFNEMATTALLYEQGGVVFWAAPEALMRDTLGNSLDRMMQGIADYQNRSHLNDSEKALDRDFAHYGDLLLNPR